MEEMNEKSIGVAKSGHRIYVSSIHSDTTEDEIKSAFGTFGKILSFEFAHGPIVDKNCGFIEYESASAADDAIAFMHNFVLRGEYLQVGKSISPPKIAQSAPEFEPSAPKIGVRKNPVRGKTRETPVCNSECRSHSSSIKKVVLPEKPRMPRKARGRGDQYAEDYQPTKLERKSLKQSMSTHDKQIRTTDVGDKIKVCPDCHYSTKYSSNFKRHLATHKKTSDNAAGSLVCPEENCAMFFKRIHQIDSHLQRIHGRIIEKEELSFKDDLEFRNWMNELRSSKCVQYIKAGSYSGVSRVLYCNRSAQFRNKAEGKGKRRLKKKGSVKSDKTCTSRLVVKHTSCGLSVTYLKTHSGHTIDPAKIGLTFPEKRYVASQLKRGVPWRKIIENLRASMSPSISRRHLANRQDVVNIARRLNFFCGDDNEAFISLSPEEKMHQLETRSHVEELPKLEKSHSKAGSSNLEDIKSLFQKACDMVADKEMEQILRDNLLNAIGLIQCRAENLTQSLPPASSNEISKARNLEPQLKFQRKKRNVAQVDTPKSTDEIIAELIRMES